LARGEDLSSAAVDSLVGGATGVVAGGVAGKINKVSGRILGKNSGIGLNIFEKHNQAIMGIGASTVKKIF